MNYSVQLACSHNYGAGRWKLTNPSELHTRARNSRSVPSRKRRGRCYFKILARFGKAELGSTALALLPWLAYADRRLSPPGTDEERRVAEGARWNQLPIPSCKQPIEVHDGPVETPTLTRFDGETGRCWMVCNILQQAMLNIMPVTATDAG